MDALETVSGAITFVGLEEPRTGVTGGPKVAEDEQGEKEDGERRQKQSLLPIVMIESHRSHTERRAIGRNWREGGRQTAGEEEEEEEEKKKTEKGPVATDYR